MDRLFQTAPYDNLVLQGSPDDPQIKHFASQITEEDSVLPSVSNNNSPWLDQVEMVRFKPLGGASKKKEQRYQQLLLRSEKSVSISSSGSSVEDEENDEIAVLLALSMNDFKSSHTSKRFIGSGAKSNSPNQSLSPFRRDKVDGAPQKFSFFAGQVVDNSSGLLHPSRDYSLQIRKALKEIRKLRCVDETQMMGKSFSSRLKKKQISPTAPHVRFTGGIPKAADPSFKIKAPDRSPTRLITCEEENQEEMSSATSFDSSSENSASVKTFAISKLNPFYDEEIQGLLSKECSKSEEVLATLKSELRKCQSNIISLKKYRRILELAPSKRNSNEASDILFLVKELPFFTRRCDLLGSTEVKQVAQHFKFKHIAESQYVISDSQRGDTYYYILKGVVRVQEANTEIENWSQKRAEYERLYKWKTSTFDPKHEEAKRHFLMSKDLERRRSLLRNRLKAKHDFCRQATISFQDNSHVGSSMAANKFGSRRHMSPSRKESTRSNNLTGLSINQGMTSSSMKITAALQGLNLQKGKVEPQGAKQQDKKQLEETSLEDYMALTPKERDWLAKYEAYEKLEWYTETGYLSSGDDFGGFSEDLGEFRSTTQVITVSDCYFAALSSKDFHRMMKKVEQENYDRKLEFFRNLPCLNRIGLMLLKRLMSLFQVEVCKLNDFVYKQGEPAEKVYIIFEGDFEVIRRKNNKLTKKEEAHKKIRFMNNLSKPGKQVAPTEDRNSKIGKGNVPLPLKAQLANLDLHLPPTFIKMATVGKGYMLGQEDVINDRNYTTSIRCLSNSSLLYSIEKEDFIDKMQKKEQIWEKVVQDSLEKDLLIRERVIQATKDKKAYAQFYKKIKLREDWGKKHNVNIEKGSSFNDWRTTFRLIVDSKNAEEDTSEENHSPSPIDKLQQFPNLEEDPELMNDNLDKLLQAAVEQQKDEPKRATIKSTIQDKLIEQANNKLEDFIDNFDMLKLPSQQTNKKESEKDKALTGIRAIEKQYQDRRRKASVFQIKKLEMQAFRNMMMKKKEFQNENARTSKVTTSPTIQNPSAQPGSPAITHTRLNTRPGPYKQGSILSAEMLIPTATPVTERSQTHLALPHHADSSVNQEPTTYFSNMLSTSIQNSEEESEKTCTIPSVTTKTRKATKLVFVTDQDQDIVDKARTTKSPQPQLLLKLRSSVASPVQRLKQLRQGSPGKQCLSPKVALSPHSKIQVASPRNPFMTHRKRLDMSQIISQGQNPMKMSKFSIASTFSPRRDEVTKRPSTTAHSEFDHWATKARQITNALRPATTVGSDSRPISEITSPRSGLGRSLVMQRPQMVQSPVMPHIAKAIELREGQKEKSRMTPSESSMVATTQLSSFHVKGSNYPRSSQVSQDLKHLLPQRQRRQQRNISLSINAPEGYLTGKLHSNKMMTTSHMMQPRDFVRLQQKEKVSFNFDEPQPNSEMNSDLQSLENKPIAVELQPKSTGFQSYKFSAIN